MKNFKRAFAKKLKGFRPTVVSIIMILLVTFRMFCSGKGIMIAGVCAGIVPFMCQFRNYPAKDEKSSELINILADFFLNILYMIVYLAYILMVTWLGLKLNPGYVQYSCFWETMLIAICANMVFISVIFTVGAFLNVKQRMMIGIIMINAQLGIMLLSETVVRGQPMINIYCSGFVTLIIALTLSFIWISYSKKN